MGATPKGGGGGRFGELDALRGLAALAVVFQHHLLALPRLEPGGHAAAAMGWFRMAPLHAAWDGHAAVILFFVLSGFVLSLPYHRGTNPTYRAYLLKRGLRIYPPYWVAVGAAIVLGTWLGGAEVAGLSRWVNGPWSSPATPLLVAQHALLVPSFRNNAFDPVLWSLVHEVRLSIAFPLLMALVLGRGWRTVLAGSVALSLAGLLAARLGGGRLGDYPLTLYYVVAFVVGALAAGHRESLIARYRRLPDWGKAAWFVGAIGLYDFEYVLPGARLLHAGPSTDYAATLGAAMLVVGVLGSPRAGGVLLGRVPAFLGRISYSLYLIHAVVLLAMVHLLAGALPLGALLPASMAIGISLAAISYRFIEAPTMALARRLTSPPVAARGGVQIPPAGRPTPGRPAAPRRDEAASHAELEGIA